MTVIYILTNIINNKQYIGKTTRGFDRRLSDHLCGVNTGKGFILHKAIRKYGIENFHIECLEVSDGLANLWEKHLIKRWNSKAPNGYNLTDGGEGIAGLKHSVETKKKISLCMICTTL